MITASRQLTFKCDRIFFCDHLKSNGILLLKELFEDVGAVRVARQSLGTAEIVFERRADAVNAQQKYNGLNLDGKAFVQTILYQSFGD